MWNQAATLKHLWRVITDSSSLWTSWVQNNILKGRSIWSINVPSNPSPTWKKILQCHELCRGLITTWIGDGAAPSLWYDYLLPQEQWICDLLSHRILATSGLGWNAKVSNIINGSNWAFPPGHQNLSSIWTSINFQPNSSKADHQVWPAHRSGTFSISSPWEAIRQRNPINPISNIIWYLGHIPRQAFILWLASRGKLNLGQIAANRYHNNPNLCVV